MRQDEFDEPQRTAAGYYEWTLDQSDPDYSFKLWGERLQFHRFLSVLEALVSVAVATAILIEKSVRPSSSRMT